MPSTTSAEAIEKAKSKRDLKRDLSSRLAGHPLDAQRDVLAELLLELEAEPTPKSVTPPPSASEVTSKRKAPGGALSQKRRPGRPKGSVVGGSRTEALYRSLKETPRMSIADLAAKHYPGEASGTHKVRAMLWSLKKQGRADNPEPGQWEITDAK